MRPIPPKLKAELEALPRMHVCARAGDGHVCKGRITWEHCWIYTGKQINEKWAIIGLCENAHLGPELNKEINRWISINLASPEDFAKYPRKNWEQLKTYLNKKYAARKAPVQRESVELREAGEITFEAYDPKRTMARRQPLTGRIRARGA